MVLGIQRPGDVQSHHLHLRPQFWLTLTWRQTISSRWMDPWKVWVQSYYRRIDLSSTCQEHWCQQVQATPTSKGCYSVLHLDWGGYIIMSLAARLTYRLTTSHWHQSGRHQLQQPALDFNDYCSNWWNMMWNWHIWRVNIITDAQLDPSKSSNTSWPSTQSTQAPDIPGMARFRKYPREHPPILELQGWANSRRWIDLQSP